MVRSLRPIDWEAVISSQSSQRRFGRVTDSCFLSFGAHQCGILMDVLGWLAVYVSTNSVNTCSFNKGRQGGYSLLFWVVSTIQYSHLQSSAVIKTELMYVRTYVHRSLRVDTSFCHCVLWTWRPTRVVEESNKVAQSLMWLPSVPSHCWVRHIGRQIRVEVGGGGGGRREEEEEEGGGGGGGKWDSVLADLTVWLLEKHAFFVIIAYRCEHV